MHKVINAIVLAAGVITLAGCSSTPTKVDKGPIAARTFQYVNTGNKPSPSYSLPDNRVHRIVQNAITTSMSRRGVSHVPQGGDVTVAYLIIAGNNVATAAINEYFGYGRDVSALQDKAQKEYTDNKNPNYFEAGTLVIDIVDSKSWKLLKRGHASRTILAGATPEQQVARVSEVVEEILGNTQFKN